MIKQLQRTRGEALYADLLFALTHQPFPVQAARQVWQDIVRHKDTLNRTLGRNVGVGVAAMDYLTNVEHTVDNPVVISSPMLATIASAAARDGLTGLFNQTMLLARLEFEIQRYRRYGDEFGLVLIDVDAFKEINDKFGHPEGDRVLVVIADLVNGLIRKTDVAARYGGDELAVVTPRTSLSKALELAERVRCRVRAAFGTPRKTTVSVGVGSCPRDGANVDGLLERVDRALYRAKREGKDRTCALPEARA